MDKELTEEKIRQIVREETKTDIGAGGFWFLGTIMSLIGYVLFYSSIKFWVIAWLLITFMCWLITIAPEGKETSDNSTYTK